MTDSVLHQSTLEAILRSEGGIDFLRWLLLDTCGILRSPMAATDNDIKYLCGRQDVGYALLDLLTAHSPKTLTALLEPPNAD